jgi:soluble lytic murein transglycosylase-like protein
MKRSIIIWIVILLLALWVNSTFARSVPEFVDGAWVMPEHEASAAPSGQYGGGYEAIAYDACAMHGCDGGYLYSILLCESGGDPNAWHANPYGGSDIGIMQINDATWGSIAYADAASQIYWAAEKLAAGMGYIWSCG